MIYIDMDGVVADFDEQYFRHFGKRPTRWPDKDSVDWDKVRAVPNFYGSIPMMQDARELIEGIKHKPFAMLTGVPKEVSTSSNEKIDWIRTNVDPIAGREVGVLCCRSRNKFHYCKPLDLLVDDYLKYRANWLNAGGVFIHHTSAAASLTWLRELGAI